MGDIALSKYDYIKQVQEDAQDFIDEYIDTFIEETQPILDHDDADDFSSEFYQWMSYDGKLHEWMDTSFPHYDAEEVCDYTDNLENDTGIWQGVKDWRQIRDTIAFYSLKTDIWFAIEEKLEELYDEAETLVNDPLSQELIKKAVEEEK